MSRTTIATDLYWSLPGPRKFIARVAESISSSRILWVNLPTEVLPGTWEGVLAGLRDAHIENPINLIIRGGTNIASDIGVHFSAKRITAEELISLEAPRRTAIVLRAEGIDGAKNCNAYAQEYLEALGKGCGNVHLVIAGHDDSLTADIKQGEIQVIAFDGGLSADEMDAYVALRMLSRPGPGSTRLSRAIISEFAGFDVELAEQLIQLDESQIVNIVDNLGVLMGAGPYRWRSDSWLMRTRSSSAPGMTHVLHDCFLSEHGLPDEKEKAASRVKARYWRACVKTLTPWLEERRVRVIEYFSSEIQRLASTNNGKIAKPLPNNKIIYIDPAELEYNNIVGISRNAGLSINTADQAAALSICKTAKDVRDDIAHLRMPKPENVSRLINEMDRLVISKS